MLNLADLNILAIVVAGIVGMVLGALWYSNMLFKNAWLTALGKTEEELSTGATAMIGAMACCLVTAITIGLIVHAFSAYTLLAGATVGALCGFGLVATAMLSDSLFCGWGWRLYFIQSGYRVTYMILMGGVIGAWPA